MQRRVHELFLQRFASGEPVTKEEVAAITQWKPKTLNTYWSKQFRGILAPRPGGGYRVTEAFREYTDFKKFRALVTQVKRSDEPTAAPDYTATGTSRRSCCLKTTSAVSGTAPWAR